MIQQSKYYGHNKSDLFLAHFEHWEAQDEYVIMIKKHGIQGGTYSGRDAHVICDFINHYYTQNDDGSLIPKTYKEN